MKAIIISLAKKSVVRYRLYGGNLKEAIEDLESESIIILNDYNGNDKEIYLYKKLSNYIKKQKYHSNKFDKTLDIDDTIVKSNYNLENEFIISELGKVIKDFKNNLSGVYSIVFNGFEEEKEIKKIAIEIGLSPQRVGQIRDSIAQKLKNYLKSKKLLDFI
jgi:DNA-directed RNA polymerase specialized sigma subunit